MLHDSIIFLDSSTAANLTIESAGTLPAVGPRGRLFYLTGTGLQVSDGTSWASVGTGMSDVTSVNGFTGAVVLSTTNIAEGTNLYYTNTRARNAISVTGSLAYDSSTGVISYTTPTLTSGAITTALGFTPYNASNPSGYISANQNITFTGDASGSGTTAVTLTLANSGVSTGTYKSVTVDAKGRVTAGTNPTTLSGYGITDALNSISGGSVGGTVTLTSGATVTGVPTPVNGTDVANKNYIDAAISGVANGTSWRQNAQAATTANITLSGLQTIDGYSVQSGDRVLVKNQTTQTENGVYVADASSWTRATDTDTGAEIQGMAILILNGTANGLSQWINTNTSTITIGTTNITYTQLQAPMSPYTAGTGLTLSSNQFSITNTGVSAGTYSKVTVNAQGQVTVGANISSSDVTTALGFTPYNATNPSGYISANQNITYTGDATGSGTTSVALTLANSGVTAGTYTKITVDAKGRATVGAQLSSGDVTTALGFTPISTNQNITFTGDATGSGTTAVTLTLANSGVTASTYRSVTVNAKGLVTAGTNPTTLAGYGITDAISNTGGSVSGSLTFTSGTVTGLATPSAGTDAATKTYVDSGDTSTYNSVSWKFIAAVATTANITLSGLQTIDGYSVQANDRVLVKNQTTATQNGMYVAASGAWTRTADATTGANIIGMVALILNGSSNALTQWTNTNTSAITVGTTNITYSQVAGASTPYTAGTGLTLSSNQFSITNTGVSTGTFTKVTVNAQGQVTVGANIASSDVTTALGFTPYNATNPSGYISANQTITLSGDVTGSGTTAITATLANSGVTAGTYTKVTVDAKGRTTVGANLASGDVTTALGYTPVNKAGDTMSGAFNQAPTVNVASAATTLIGAAGANDINITGSTTITAFDTVAAGAIRNLNFLSALTLTHNASTLILPGAANITTATNDQAQFVSKGGGIWVCQCYTRANGTSIAGSPDATKLPLAGGTMSGAINEAPTATVASAATTNIGAAAANTVSVTGTTTITAFDTIAAGAIRRIVFAGALTLTHNATSLILPTGANITTAAGDIAEFVSLGSGNWRCTYYTKAGTAYATLTGTETLTNKTLSNDTITGFVESGATATGSSFSPDFTTGTDFEYTTNANTTITLPTAVAGRSYTITVKYGGTHSVTFAGGTSIKYPGGTAPTATSVSGKWDIYICKCDRAATATIVSDGGRNI